MVIELMLNFLNINNKSLFRTRNLQTSLPIYVSVSVIVREFLVLFGFICILYTLPLGLMPSQPISKLCVSIS